MESLVTPRRWISRRSFLYGTAAAGGSLIAAGALPGRLLAQTGPAIVRTDRIAVPYGVQAGDITGDRAIVWSRADRPGRMIVEWDTVESLRNARRVEGPAALAHCDYTAKVDLSGLPRGQTIFYRVRFVDLADSRSVSEPVVGRFKTPSDHNAGVRFTWTGDTAGQGWGINPDFGGMKLYEAMRQVQPDFFIHSGDMIYADNPIPAEKEIPGGGVWKNLVTEAKSKVAETLDEFRGNYIYNLMDENVRRFNAEVPMLAQWDDHEVVNNWYPTEVLTSDDRYTVKSVDLLAARASQAFVEYNPVRVAPDARIRLYNAFHYGPHLDVFRIDMRSYRGPNTRNDQTAPGPETEFLGRAQVRWLKRALLESRATWKVIASDMPIGLVVRDGETAFENLANGDGPARGRELEMADLLRFIKHNGIRNVVWVTADVHYAAAHYYDPNRAQFQDFAPFWEFVAGPANAGSFGPNRLDNTFGPEVRFVKAPPEGQANLPPSAGLQFFGQVDIDGDTGQMTVALKDLNGETLFTQELTPETVA